LLPPNDTLSTNAPILPSSSITADPSPTPAPPPPEPTGYRVTTGNIDEYAAIGGLLTAPPDTLTTGQQMKERGKTAYRGLIAVVQALSDCSDIFLPLKTACNVILTIHETFDVRKIR
jgi:hypothetical protein